MSPAERSRQRRRKEAAHAAVHKAIREGRLERHPKTCASCGVAGSFGKASQPHWSIQYHHDLGYDPAHHLDVVPVCAHCHKQIHHGKRMEPRSGKRCLPEMLPRRHPDHVPAPLD